jgi:hypothetical protein
MTADTDAGELSWLEEKHVEMEKERRMMRLMIVIPIAVSLTTAGPFPPEPRLK